MKKAIIAACTGTAEARAAAEYILPIERALAEAFPGWEVRRAFTSRRIAAATGTATETEAIERLRAEGYKKIVIASLHLLPGSEYSRLSDAGLPASAPLLDSDADLLAMAELLQGMSAEENRALLAIGHGSDHAAETWARLERLLPEDVFLTRLDENPACAAHRLPKKPLVLLPLMLTAGRHARRDVDGAWLPALTELGFDVRLRMEGLGAREEVQKMIVQKVRNMIGGNENG